MCDLGINAHSHNRGARLLTLDLCEYAGYEPIHGQMVMVGLHPWSTLDCDSLNVAEQLRRALAANVVVGVGEVGVDPFRGASLERQEELLRLQLAVAVEANMPVMFHVVRRYDMLLRLHREFKPTAAWGVHGFRAKPDEARKLAEAGIYMSVGERFNVEAVREIPLHLLMVETDDLPLAEMEGVVASVAEARGMQSCEVAEAAGCNLMRFIYSGKSIR